MPQNFPSRSFRLFLTFSLLLILLGGCHSKLSQTPIVYQDTGLDPFLFTDESDKTTQVNIFYATGRKEKGVPEQQEYGNDFGKGIRLGRATVQIGDDNMTWDDLRAASMTKKRRHDVPVKFIQAYEYGMLTTTIREKWLKKDPQLANDTSGEQAFADAVNERLARSMNKDICIYIHGFNDHYKSHCQIVAELSHFLGHSSVMMVYLWPCRQSARDYPFDLMRAHETAPDLAKLIEFLANHTRADEIDLFGYSAGATLLADALVNLRGRHPDDNADELKMKLRVGDVIFAAADVSFRTFAGEYIRDITDLTRHLHVYYAPSDYAMAMSSMVNLGSRLGAPNIGELSEKELEELVNILNISAINVDYSRSFYGPGNPIFHGYWHTNSWVFTDLLLNLRANLTPADRQLELIPGQERIYYFPEDYPQRMADLVTAYRQILLSEDQE